MAKFNNSNREKLIQICEPLTGDFEEQKKQIEAQVQRIQNETEIKTLSQLTDDQNIDVNCHAYTLNAWKVENFLKINKWVQVVTRNKLNGGGSYNSVNGLLIKFLLNEKILKPQNSPSKDDIAIYFNDEEYPTHSGIVLNDEKNIMIESKSGVLPVMQHQLWDVPFSNSTASSVSFFVKLEQEFIKGLFNSYLEFIDGNASGYRDYENLRSLSEKQIKNLFDQIFKYFKEKLFIEA